MVKILTYIVLILKALFREMYRSEDWSVLLRIMLLLLDLFGIQILQAEQAHYDQDSQQHKCIMHKFTSIHDGTLLVPGTSIVHGTAIIHFSNGRHLILWQDQK